MLFCWWFLESLLISVVECKESKACSPAKHHFDECVERVTGADHGKAVDKKHPEEDCVEECKSP
jgi:Ubiquinol-cytochrome C reductase hinge protein